MSAKSAHCRSRRYGLALGAAILLTSLTSVQAKACEVSAENPDAVLIDYNPFAIGTSTGPLDVTFVNRSDTACELRLRLVDDVGDPLSEVSVGSVVVTFVPRESSGLLQRGTEPGVFQLTVGPNATLRAELDASVVRNAVVEAGEHGADLYLSISGPDDQPLLPRIPVRLVLKSTPRAQVNIAGGAGAFGSGSTVEVIDFGIAATGVTRRAFLQVRANAKSNLTVRSEHRGVMRHVEGGEVGSSVPYGLELDGLVVDLAEAWTHPVDPPRTLDGISLPLDFTLGEVGPQMSGEYKDLITIDITPN